MMRILLLVIIKKFYERNSGFFLFVFFLMFGIVESTQIVNYHLSLIYGMINLPIFLGVVFLLWLLYMIKCISFFQQALSSSENLFLKQLNLLSARRQFLLISYPVIVTYLPVLLYTALILGVAIRTNHYAVAISIVGFHCLLIFLGTRYIFVQLNSTNPRTIILPSIHWPWPKPFPLFYLNLLTSKLKAVLFVTKVFSISSILLFIQIPLDHYEYRTALMGFLFGLAAHSVIVFEFRKLEDENLYFMRGLPFSISQRFALITITYALLLLPEFIVLLVNPINYFDATLVFFAGLSFLLFSHCSLYNKRINMDSHLQKILWMFLLGFGLTLFNLALPTAFLFFIFSFVRYRKNYYLYEVSN